MPNQQFNKFNFAYLNNAQDPVDVGETEGVQVDALDLDDIALGTLQASDYLSQGFAPKDFTTAMLNGRNFRLNNGVLQFEPDSDSPGVWRDVGDVPAPTLSTLVLESGVGVSSDSTGIPGTVTGRITPGQSYTGSGDTTTYIIEIDDDVSTPNKFKWKKSTDDTFQATGVDILTGGNYTILDNNVEITFSQDTGFTNGEQATVTVNNPNLKDGQYFYLAVGVNNDSASIKPLDNIQSLQSSILTVTIDNLNSLGDRKSSNVAKITVPGNGYSVNVDEVWLFRKFEEEDAYTRVFVNATGSDVIFSDSVNLSQLPAPIILYDGIDDQSFSAIDDIIGNPSNEYVKLFEKDNRLWLVPSDRQDVVLYSRISDFWGWSPDQSFKMSGNITDFEFMKDQLTVGGQIITVMFTDVDLYHITGQGTEDSPYELIKAFEDVRTKANSVVNMNGIIILQTFSDSGAYDEGPYGQKIYTYDLQKLVEVSARVKNSPLMSNTDPLSFSALIGGDKYIISNGSDKDLVYHRDANGWMETNSTLETASDWLWKSKVYTSTSGERFKLFGARKFKIDFEGSITVTWTIDDYDVVIPLNNPARAAILYQFPNLKGKEWQFTVQGTGGAIVYDFFFVS